MKISVLLYLSGREDDSRLERALVFAGIRVCRIGNLSKLHTILASRCFDAILVSRKTLAYHCMNAARHLWQTRSTHSIIDWEADSTGAISRTMHSIPASVTGIAEPPDREEKLAAISEILDSVNLRHETIPSATTSGQDPATETTPSEPTKTEPVSVPPEVAGSLHAKLGLIIETIAATGSAGIDIQTLARRVWGAEERDRKKDIQIYVSKLRKALTKHTPDRYSITFENRRYYLRDSSRDGAHA
jgi:hypothetical protein